jgi:hypothetical protein
LTSPLDLIRCSRRGSHRPNFYTTRDGTMK